MGWAIKAYEKISDNLGQHHEVLFLSVQRAALRGRGERKGAQEGRTYSQRTQLEAQHEDSRATLVAPTLFWICESVAAASERQLLQAWFEEGLKHIYAGFARLVIHGT